MSEKIIIPESVSDHADLYDGYIIAICEGDVNLSDLNKNEIEAVYARLLHYADIMKYEDNPIGDLDKHNQAQKLADKLNIYINEDQFRKAASICESVLFSMK